MNVGFPGSQVELLAAHQSTDHPTEGLQVPQVAVLTVLTEVEKQLTIKLGSVLHEFKLLGEIFSNSSRPTPCLVSQPCIYNLFTHFFRKIEKLAS